MASIAEVARQRKGQLRSLMVASRKLDAAQEALEREVKRLINRKQSVPEVLDAQRLLSLARATDGALDGMISVLESVSASWGSV